MSIQELVMHPMYKKIMGYVYGWGAAVAIIGALFKIMHFPGASVMLVAGLGVEALIFFMSAFEPPHEMPDWTLVYPELLGLDEEPGVELGKGNNEVEGAVAGAAAASTVAGAHGGEHHTRKSHSTAPDGGFVGNGFVGGGGSELSALVSAGAIEQKTIDELSEGVKKLANTTSQMADLAEASTATKAYINNVKVASESMNQFAAVQSQAVELGSKLSSSSEKLNETISSQAGISQQMTNSMAAVNEAYNKQLQGINNQIKTNENLVNGLSSISNEINASVEGVKQYRQQIASLNKTVTELNSIYGNMLSAVSNR